MTLRRLPILAVLIAASLHFWGVASAPLPAQDGLKFIKTARGFGSRPWGEVIRGTDQHPLYPICVAAVHPAVALLAGDSPDGWRIAAQLVSITAYFALLIPLRRITARMFGDRTAYLCVLMFVLLPVPAELGRDTLSDALGMLCLLIALDRAALGLAEGTVRHWLEAGIAAGLGYLARPEVVLVAASAGVVFARGIVESRRAGGFSLRPARAGLMLVAALVPIGGYALVKGEVSEKLALRTGVSLPPSAPPKSAAAPLPPGLDDPRWDFSAKEETGRSPLRGRPGKVVARLAQQWFEGIGFVFAPVAALGLIFRRRLIRSEGAFTERLLSIHLSIFGVVVVRHASTLGYLSGRHAMTLVLGTLPFAAAAFVRWGEGFPARRGISAANGRRLAAAGLCGLIVLGVSAQAKAMHPSRRGHLRAGRWLVAHARPDEAVLDTRGWATFVRPGPSHDYWHVKQALADPRLAYVVVGSDELDAGTPRAATLRALLRRAGSLAASYSDRDESGESRSDVLVYRFKAPETWEGTTP